MSFAYFLAKRIDLSKGDDTKRVSPPAIRIAIAGIAIGLAVMLLTVAIVIGFKQEIRNKIADFGGHLQVLAIANNRTYEKQPICCNDSLLNAIKQLEGVKKALPFITKPAVLKSDSDFLSIVVKGQDLCLDNENGIAISETIARKMKLKLGDRVRLYFVQSGDAFTFGSETSAIKSRTVVVDSLYQTHFNEYDSQIVLAPSALLQTVSEWDEDMASGIEVTLQNLDLLENAYLDLSETVSQTQDRKGTQLYVQTIRQLNPQIFAWLDLLDTNVWVIITLMLVVATFTMISGLLIIILERTPMIGILKAMGCNNKQLQTAFLFVAMRLTARGLFWGNLIGLGLCWIQATWHIIPLDPENYYLEWVPVSIDCWHILVLNIATLFITLLILIVPSAFVAHIAPSKAIQTE